MFSQRIVIFSTTRCANVGKPKAAGCGKKSKGADKKTYYGEKKNRQTDDEMTKEKKKYNGEKKKTDRRSQKKNRQPDDQMTNQKRHNRTYNKSMHGRIENVLEKPRWVLV